MYEKIMVPLDGSAAAETALPYAEEIAARSGASVALVSVFDPSSGEPESEFRSYLDRLTTQVQCELDNLNAKAETRAYSNILPGKPASRIIDYAEANNIDLIAMAASGESEKGPWALGSIAAKVLRATSRPVLLVRKPAGADMIKSGLIKKVLIPLDGSEIGESAIPQVESLAKALDFEVLLLHVMEPIITAAMPGLAAITIPTAAQEAARESASIDYLQKIETRFRNAGLSVSSAVRSGSAGPEILSFAVEKRVDLIAMSSHGRSGIGRWVFGSITDKVLHAGETPVLAVRAK